jgi:hypothetical protein
LEHAKWTVLCVTIGVLLLYPRLGAAQSPSTTPQPHSVTSTQAQTVRDTLVSRVASKWTGDLDGMIARRAIRVATTHNRTHFFIDKGVQRGAVYERSSCSRISSTSS